MVKLHNDIRDTFPPGKLPPIQEVTARPKEEIEALLKGPLVPGGRSIYSLQWPF
jgi:creatinine amidohydrolase